MTLSECIGLEVFNRGMSNLTLFFSDFCYENFQTSKKLKRILQFKKKKSPWQLHGVKGSRAEGGRPVSRRLSQSSRGGMLGAEVVRIGGSQVPEVLPTEGWGYREHVTDINSFNYRDSL